MCTRLSIRTVRLDAFKREIAEHLSCRDLSLAAVARRQGIAQRHVQLLFRAEGTTFSRFVLRERLKCAHRMLMHPQYSGWTISAIAFEVGFGDLSYFNHAFRRCYAVSPIQHAQGGARKLLGGISSSANDNDNHALKSVNALSATPCKRASSATMVQVCLQERGTGKQTGNHATRL